MAALGDEDDETIKLVEEKYQKDLDLFGYDFKSKRIPY